MLYVQGYVHICTVQYWLVNIQYWLFNNFDFCIVDNHLLLQWFVSIVLNNE